MTISLGYLLKQAQYLYRQQVEEMLRPLELTAPQYGVLAALQRQPEATNATLARMCFVTPQTMIQVVEGLHRRGLVDRRPHPEHGRLIQTRLTARGERVLAAAHRTVDSVDRRAFAPLSATDRKHLARILQTCVGNLDASPTRTAADVVR